MTHDDIAELADLYVLDALPMETAEAVEEHLADCVTCQQEVERAWEAARLLRLAVPPAAPSPALHDRIMSIVRAEAGGRAPETRAVPPEPAPRRWTSPFTVPRWLSTVAMLPLLLASWLTWQLLTSQQQAHTTELALNRSWQNAHEASEVFERAMQRGGGSVSVEGADAAPTASGTLYYVRNENEGVLVVRGLPALHEGEVYQCWVMSGEKRVNAGTLHREDDGQGMLVVKAPMPLETADGLRVTNEPRSGSPEPRGAAYLWARIKGT